MERSVYLPAAKRATVPWKNGGGVTTDVATCPRGASNGGWDWRISMATFDRPGPFSRFEEVDRVLLLLSGALRLRLSDDDAPVELLPGDVIRFAGDVPVFGEPRGGAAADLNIMSRRGRWQIAIDRLTPATGGDILLSADTAILFFEGEGSVDFEGHRSDMLPHDALMIGQADRETAHVISGHPVYLIGISAALRVSSTSAGHRPGG